MGDAGRGARRRGAILGATLASLSARTQRFGTRLREAAAGLRGYLALLFAATAAWILLWAWYDFEILAVAFPSAAGYRPNLDAYWMATWWVLFPITTLLLFRRHAWLPILALAIGGWEDILFYWIQGKPVPSALTYLPQTPTSEALYLRAAFFLAAAAVGAIVVRLPRTRIRCVPLELLMVLAGLLGSLWIFAASIPAYGALKVGWTYWAGRRASQPRAGP